jgi:hypothetical protein
VVEAANIAPVVVTVCCLGLAEFEKLSGGSLRLSSPKVIEASRRRSSIRRMNDYGMTAHGAQSGRSLSWYKQVEQTQRSNKVILCAASMLARLVGRGSLRNSSSIAGRIAMTVLLVTVTRQI